MSKKQKPKPFGEGDYAYAATRKRFHKSIKPKPFAVVQPDLDGLGRGYLVLARGMVITCEKQISIARRRVKQLNGAFDAALAERCAECERPEVRYCRGCGAKEAAPWGGKRHSCKKLKRGARRAT